MAVDLDTPGTEPQLPTWSKRQRFVFAALLGLGLALVIYGFSTAKTGDDDVRITDPAIERLIPKPGDLVLRQGQVGIDLAPGYTGVLVIDGQEIATYQVGQSESPTAFDQSLDVQYDQGTGTLLYTPRTGGPIEAFSPGGHIITARYWQLQQGREASRTFTWTFSVS